MRPARLRIGRRIGFVLALLLPSVMACAGERQYRELTTPEFTLVSAVSERETRRIALQIGMFRAAIEHAFGVPLSTAIPMRIYALSGDDWTRYAQPRDGVAGYFVAQPFSCDLLFDAEDEAGGAYELMFHEYTHYILRTFWVNDLPAFFDEGLAEVFSTARFERGHVRLAPRRDHVRFLGRHAWLPFERLLKVRREDAEYVDHALAPAFYAQAWASLYYVIAKDPAVGGRVMDYVRELKAGQPPLTAAEHLIGGVSGEANHSIAEFVADRRLPSVGIRLPGTRGLDTASIRMLSRDEKMLAIGELLLRIGNRHAQARDLFEDVERRLPREPRARVGTAWARLQAGESTQAGALFDGTAELAVSAPATSVSLGRGLFQLAAARHAAAPLDDQQRARLRRARGLFGSAMTERSTRLEAINGYVLASLALDEREASLIALAQGAYEAAPRSPELAVGLALLHELDGRKDLARRYWHEAARNSRAGPMRAQILSVLEQDARPGGTSALEHLRESHD